MTRRSRLQRTRQRKMILSLTTTTRNPKRIPCVVMPPCKKLLLLITLQVLVLQLVFQKDPSKKLYLRDMNQQLQYLNSFPSGVIAFHSSSWMPLSTIQRRRHNYFHGEEGSNCWQRRGKKISKQLSTGSTIYSINNDLKNLSFLHHGRIQQHQHYSLSQRPLTASSDCLIARLQAKRNENEEEDNNNDDLGGMVKPLFVRNRSASGSGDSSSNTIGDEEEEEDPVISARAPVLGVMNTIETKLGEEDSLRRSASSSTNDNDDMLENDDLMFFSDTPPSRSSTLPTTTRNEPPKKETIKKRGLFSRFFGGGGESSTTIEPTNGSSAPPKQEKVKDDAMKLNKPLNPSLPLVNASMTSSDTTGSEKADKPVSSNTVVSTANQKEELPVVKTATSTLFPSPSRTKATGASVTSSKVSSSPPASDVRAKAGAGTKNRDSAAVPIAAGVSNGNTNSNDDNLIQETQNTTAALAAAPTTISATNNDDSKGKAESTTSSVDASAAPMVVVAASNSETSSHGEEASENPSSAAFSSISDADGRISKKRILLSWITPFRNTFQATQQAQENENKKSDDDIRRERLKDLEDDRRHNSHNALPRARAPPSLRRLLERETLRLGEAAEVFNISSTAAILIEQAQTRKRALIRNVEQVSNRGTTRTASVPSSFDNKQVTGQKSSSSPSLLSKFVRVFLSPAGWSGKFKYVSFAAFLLLAAPLPKRFSVMEPSSQNFYGEGSSNWNNQKYYHRYDDGRQTAKLPEKQQSTSLEERPTKYAAAATDQSSPSAQAIEEQRHYISSFVAKAVRKVGPSVIRIDTERYVDGPVLGGGGRSIPPPSSTPFFGLEDFDSGEDDDGTQHGGGSGGVDQRPIEQGQGSGIIFSEDGLVLTNAHVVEGASRVTVTLTDGRRYVAEVKGQDEMVDLAVLQMVSSPSSSSSSSSESISGGNTKEKDNPGKDGAKENKKEGTTKQQSPKVKPTAAKEKEDEPRKSRWEGEPLPVAVLGNSETVEVGEWVIAVGNPVGLDNTVTMGIISSIKRSSAEVGIPNKKVEFIQTDAAINPGNSGGPLVNEHGDIIGINTCIRANAEGIGFAIPINKAKSIMYELAEGRNIQHGYIGIVMTTMTPDFARQNNLNPNSPAGVLPERNGALVMRVMSRTPASECGLRRFDVVVEMNGEAVSNASEAQAIVDAANVGDDMKLKILRGEKEMLLTVKPGDLGQKIREAKERQQQRLQQQQQQLLPPQQMIPPGMFPQGDGQGGRIFIFPMMPAQ